MANDIFAQRMALRSNALGGIMQALAQIKRKQEEEQEQADIQKQIESALFQTTPAQQFSVPTNANVPSAMPSIPQMGTGRASQAQNALPMQSIPIAGFAGRPQQQMTLPAQRQFNPTPEALLQLLINPKTAGGASNVIGGMKAFSEMMPKTSSRVISGGDGSLFEYDPQNPSGTLTPLKPASPKKEERLLRTADETVNGVTNKVDVYGYTDEGGKEVITNRRYRDVTPVSTMQNERIVRDITDKFNADPNTRKQIAKIDAANQIEDLLNARNPVADASIPTFMARLSGEVGALSEADKAPFGGSQSIQQKISRATTKAINGTLDEADRKFVADLVKKLKAASLRNIKAMASQRAKQYSKTMKNMTEADIYDVLSAGFSSYESAPQNNGGEQNQVIEIDY